MDRVVNVFRPLLFSFMSSCHTKRLICDMIDRYVETTDNDIDNTIARIVRDALLRDCK